MARRWQIELTGAYIRTARWECDAAPPALLAFGGGLFADTAEARSQASERAARGHTVTRWVRFWIAAPDAVYVHDDAFKAAPMPPARSHSVSSDLLDRLFRLARLADLERWALLLDAACQTTRQGLWVHDPDQQFRLVEGLGTVERDGLYVTLGSVGHMTVVLALADNPTDAETRARRIWPDAWAADLDPWPVWLHANAKRYPAAGDMLNLDGERIPDIPTLPVGPLGIDPGDAYLVATAECAIVIQRTGRGPLVWSLEPNAEAARLAAQRNATHWGNIVRSVLTGPVGRQ